MLSPATAQITRPDSTEVFTHYSLYWEHFKNGNYEDALPDLRWSLENAPESPYNDARNYERGVMLYDSLAARTDAQRRSALDAVQAAFEAGVLSAQDAEDLARLCVPKRALTSPAPLSS